ncbi:hypothetical protein EYF80_059608 [Liparis tanakae]|uniref:Uncharacterized protein n=1 Tax=Liparis tanakae TaxID=230148 RepID=A0A4Z2ENV6_9TELE|nr:hypothetical protein EYF80_059608 [Liparis tanakae]
MSTCKLRSHEPGAHRPWDVGCHGYSLPWQRRLADVSVGADVEKQVTEPPVNKIKPVSSRRNKTSSESPAYDYRESCVSSDSQPGV